MSNDTRIDIDKFAEMVLCILEQHNKALLSILKAKSKNELALTHKQALLLIKAHNMDAHCINYYDDVKKEIEKIEKENPSLASAYSVLFSIAYGSDFFEKDETNET